MPADGTMTQPRVENATDRSPEMEEGKAAGEEQRRGRPLDILYTVSERPPVVLLPILALQVTVWIIITGPAGNRVDNYYWPCRFPVG